MLCEGVPVYGKVLRVRVKKSIKDDAVFFYDDGYRLFEYQIESVQRSLKYSLALSNQMRIASVLYNTNINLNGSIYAFILKLKQYSLRFSLRRVGRLFLNHVKQRIWLHSIVNDTGILLVTRVFAQLHLRRN